MPNTKNRHFSLAQISTKLLVDNCAFRLLFTISMHSYCSSTRESSNEANTNTPNTKNRHSSFAQISTTLLLDTCAFRLLFTISMHSYCSSTHESSNEANTNTPNTKIDILNSRRLRRPFSRQDVYVQFQFSFSMYQKRSFITKGLEIRRRWTTNAQIGVTGESQIVMASTAFHYQINAITNSQRVLNQLFMRQMAIWTRQAHKQEWQGRKFVSPFSSPLWTPKKLLQFFLPSNNHLDVLYDVYPLPLTM